ncbi:RTA1 like protein-domain-containing protein [Podospora didyma]|uniref:RTA1 like protein-domain-containing protein n=1 Tax=Podospora didyma TaxID=330526 RepID=A0AAE0K2H2_9PEZI|nr:RTA1 like protein-domain-containing protein [Podospora didyma]
MSDSTEECKAVSPACPVEATLYGYSPNLGGNAFYTVVFAVCALAQLYYATCRCFCRRRKDPGGGKNWTTYSVLTMVGCVGEACGYIGRLFLHKNPWNGAALPIQMVLLMVSPSFLAAALYTMLRPLVRHFGAEHCNRFVPARYWTWPLVTADLVGFFLQCGGGIVASMSERDPKFGSIGTAIMIFGVSFQAVVMAVAGLLVADFTLRVGRRHGADVFALLQRRLRIFLLAMTAALLLILTRCIYRIPEMAGGVGGPLMRQEAEFMIFDGLLILLAAVLQTVVHPDIFASDTQDSQTQVYELKTLLEG